MVGAFFVQHITVILTSDTEKRLTLGDADIRAVCCEGKVGRVSYDAARLIQK